MRGENTVSSVAAWRVKTVCDFYHFRCLLQPEEFANVMAVMFTHDRCLGMKSFGCTVAGKLLGYAMVMNVLAVRTVLGEEQVV